MYIRDEAQDGRFFLHIFSVWMKPSRLIWTIFSVHQFRIRREGFVHTLIVGVV